MVSDTDTDTQGETQTDSLRAPGSRVLYEIDRVASRPLLAMTIVVVDAVWVVLSLVLRFPTRLETIFQTLVAALTLAMVFVIQHTQSREQVATQRKLDEILRALPYANNALIAVEDASDSQLRRVRDDHRALRAEALERR